MLEKAIISIDNVDNQEIKMSDKLTWTKKSVLNIFFGYKYNEKNTIVCIAPKMVKNFDEIVFCPCFLSKIKN